jgi:hypothetical protein
MLAAKNVLSDERRRGQEAKPVKMHVEWYRQFDCDLIQRQVVRSNNSESRPHALARLHEDPLDFFLTVFDRRQSADTAPSDRDAVMAEKRVMQFLCGSTKEGTAMRHRARKSAFE